MNLQGRDLRYGLQGDDVQLLQSELRLLGFEIAEREQLRAYFGEETLALVRQLQGEHRLDSTGVVDESTANLINERVARQPRRLTQGVVRHQDGSPVSSLSVQAFDLALRQDDLHLGDATTDEQGRYEIGYTSEQISPRGKSQADLVVRLLGEDGSLLQESPVVFGAQPVETVDFTLADGVLPRPSDLERLTARLEPHLGSIPVGDLRPRDIAYLSGRSGVDQQQLNLLVESVRLAQETGLPHAALYIWLDGQPAANSEILWSRPTDELVAALERAVDRNQAPASLR
ncbi:MAG: peptidoglycan-binding protein, partial [Chloroflexota bacterium]|nr:peptidoglycan-binding protein [Chloroflexota bacterium]